RLAVAVDQHRDRVLERRLAHEPELTAEALQVRQRHLLVFVESGSQGCRLRDRITAAFFVGHCHLPSSENAGNRQNRPPPILPGTPWASVMRASTPISPDRRNSPVRSWNSRANSSTPPARIARKR